MNLKLFGKTHNPLWDFFDTRKSLVTIELEADTVNHITLNLGCGDDEWGDVRVDIRKESKANLIFDLNSHPYPFVDASFRRIRASHIIEHLDDPLCFLKECYRLLDAGGILDLRYPARSDLLIYILLEMESIPIFLIRYIRTRDARNLHEVKSHIQRILGWKKRVLGTFGCGLDYGGHKWQIPKFSKDQRLYGLRVATTSESGFLFQLIPIERRVTLIRKR